MRRERKREKISKEDSKKEEKKESKIMNEQYTQKKKMYMLRKP